MAELLAFAAFGAEAGVEGAALGAGLGEAAGAGAALDAAGTAALGEGVGAGAALDAAGTAAASGELGAGAGAALGEAGAGTGLVGAADAADLAGLSGFESGPFAPGADTGVSGLGGTSQVSALSGTPAANIAASGAAATPTEVLGGNFGVAAPAEAGAAPAADAGLAAGQAVVGPGESLADAGGLQVGDQGGLMSLGGPEQVAQPPPVTNVPPTGPEFGASQFGLDQADIELLNSPANANTIESPTGMGVAGPQDAIGSDVPGSGANAGASFANPNFQPNQLFQENIPPGQPAFPNLLGGANAPLEGADAGFTGTENFAGLQANPQDFVGANPNDPVSSFTPSLTGENFPIQGAQNLDLGDGGLNQGAPAGVRSSLDFFGTGTPDVGSNAFAGVEGNMFGTFSDPAISMQQFSDVGGLEGLQSADPTFSGFTQAPTPGFNWPDTQLATLDQSGVGPWDTTVTPEQPATPSPQVSGLGNEGAPFETAVGKPPVDPLANPTGDPTTTALNQVGTGGASPPAAAANRGGLNIPIPGTNMSVPAGAGIAAAGLGVQLFRGPPKVPGASQDALAAAGVQNNFAQQQLSAAQAGDLNPAQLAAVNQYVQNATNQLYQQLAGQGVDPRSSTAWQAGMAQIENNRQAMIQKFINDMFNQSFTASGQASQTQLAVSNQILQNNAQFNAAVTQAFSALGLALAGGSGIRLNVSPV